MNSGCRFISQLYGLFKLLTVSPKPTSPRPGLFDFAGRAKWDSWNTIGGQYADRAPAAEQRYLAIAKELGWHERKPGQEESSQTPDAAEPGEKRGSGSAAGMGVHVSTVTFEEDQGREEGSLHGLAISGDIQGVKNYIQKHPDTDLNAKDEHVRANVCCLGPVNACYFILTGLYVAAPRCR